MIESTPSKQAKMPLGRSGVRRDDSFSNAFRRQLETAVVRARGDMTIADGVLTWAAAKLARRVRQLEARIKKSGAAMTHSEYLAYADRLSRIEHMLTIHVRNLRLDSQGSQDAFAQLYTIRVLDEADDAAEAEPEPLQDK